MESLWWDDMNESFVKSIHSWMREDSLVSQYRMVSRDSHQVYSYGVDGEVQMLSDEHVVQEMTA